MASEFDLDAIEQRANAATEEPWAFAFVGDKSNDCVVGTFFVKRKNKRLEQVGGSVSEYIDDGIGDFDEVIASKDNDANVANFAFIAHARTDIPALIARVRELEAIIEATARESECVSINADVWIQTNDDVTGKPWLVMRNNEIIEYADTLWEAIEKGLADGK